MVSTKFLLAILLTFSGPSFGEIKKDIKVLRTIESKQILSNLRFISSDGKITFYQKNIGGLFISKNYKIRKILEGKKYSNFNVIEGKAKKIIITRDNFYLNKVNPNKPVEIFVYKDEDLLKIGEGIDPKFHLNDEWVSYYVPKDKNLIFKKTSLPPKDFFIRLNKTVDPFFRPEREMVDSNNVLYTDMNPQGETALISYREKKSKIIKKFTNLGTRIEICKKKNDIFFGVFNNERGLEKSEIFKNTASDIKLVDEKRIYKSKHGDVGKINCNFNKDSIYFLKTIFKEETNFSELFSLEIKDKKLTQLTNSKFVFNFFQMASRMFVTVDGKQLLIFGKKELADDRLPGEEVKNK